MFIILSRAQAAHLNPSHFDDVVEERKLSGICGWTLCDVKLDLALPTATQSGKKKRTEQQYSIRGNKVLDVRLRNVSDHF
jgi:hypothetical protein